MKASHLMLAAGLTAAVASVSFFAGRTVVHAAQGPAATEPAPAPPPQHEMPAPKNLQVLPKNLTGQQVHEIMETWEGELGTNCRTCHAVDKSKTGPDGKPVLNYADDSKDEKQTARKMFTMVEEINANYISKIDSSGEPVTCGTCHRGHLGPEPFAAPVRPHVH